MADFSFLSDSDESAAVEELISQAQELSVLEQVSAINCSGFTDSVLPTDLDTRFRKLKSFPLTSKQSKSKPEEFISIKKKNELKKTPDDDDDDDEILTFSPSKQNHPEDVKRGLGLKSRSGSLSISSNLSTESVAFSGSKENNSEGKKVRKSKSRHGSFHSPLSSSNSSRSRSRSLSRSPSPRSISGCFFCSPKRVVSRKKSDKNGNHDMGSVGLEKGKDDEILSDLNIFSTKEQKRILKKAMKEEEKINREAEKIVQWAKQASARMNVSDIEDELSDDDIFR